MGRNGNSRDQSVCKRVFISLIMLLMGLIFCFILTILFYFTYQTLSGDRSYCSLWIDIPGRMAIYLICFYVACLCGYFPIPRCYQPWWFPEPFTLWKYESWKNLFISLCIPTPSADLIRRLRMNAQNRRESDTLPLYNAKYKRFYNVSQRVATTRRRSAPVYINPEDEVTSVGNYPSEDENYDEVFQSFDSPEYRGFIQSVKAESSRPRFQSDTTNNRAKSFQIKGQEQVVRQDQGDVRLARQDQGVARQDQGVARQDQGVARQDQGVARQDQGVARQDQGVARQDQGVARQDQSVARQDQGVARQDEVVARQDEVVARQDEVVARQEQGVVRLEKENKTEDRHPNFPRCPWGFFRHPGGIPPIANKIHWKNLQLERQEQLIYEEKLKDEKLKAFKKVETKENVNHDGSDIVEKQSGASETTKEPKQSEDSKVRESGEYSIPMGNVDVIPDQSTSSKNDAKADRQKTTHQEIEYKKSEKTAFPYITTGTRPRLPISQKNPPQSVIRSHRQKANVKYIDDLEASKLEIRKSRPTHRRTHSEVGSTGMSEQSSSGEKQEKDTKFEEQFLVAQAQYESTQLWLRVREYTESRSAAFSNSESVQNTDLGTQRQSDLPTTSNQKTEESDAGDLPISTSKQKDEN